MTINKHEEGKVVRICFKFIEFQIAFILARKRAGRAARPGIIENHSVQSLMAMLWFSC